MAVMVLAKAFSKRLPAMLAVLVLLSILEGRCSNLADTIQVSSVLVDLSTSPADDLSAFEQFIVDPRRLQTGVTPWVDMCLDERKNVKDELCPPIFQVSTVAFNPNLPKQDSLVTIILRPSRSLTSQNSMLQYVWIKFPSFIALGPTNADIGHFRELQIIANNAVAVGQDPTLSYNSEMNRLFQSPAMFDTRMDAGQYDTAMTLILKVTPGQVFLNDRDTEILVCCMQLPLHSLKDDPKYTITGPTVPFKEGNIAEEPIKSIPYIDPGYQWDFIQVVFDPPTSKELTEVAITFRSANALPCLLPRLLSCQIIFTAPGIQYVGPGSDGTSPVAIDFVTPVTSGSGTDWKLFRYEAVWYPVREQLVFILREGITLEAFRTVTVKTKPGDFRLPVNIPANFEGLKLETRSFDGVDQVINTTSVYQSSRVPYIREFVYSELVYMENSPEVMTDVKFYFMTNRPMFQGTSIFLRLAGFSADRVEIPLVNDTKFNIRQHIGLFDLPANTIELQVNRTMYCDEMVTEIHFKNLILPPALYANDTSLLLKTSDLGSVWQSVDISPEVAFPHRRRRMVKEFVRSQVLFDPLEPRMPANITFLLQPSVVFYQGDMILLYLYGFDYAGTDVPLLGPAAYKVRDRTAQWVAELSILALVCANDEVFSFAEPLNVSIGRDTNFRLPDKLSLNDGILRIEGRGANIIKEPFKKTPFLGAQKFVIDSRLELEPIEGGILEDSVARMKISLILNTDVLPNATLFIKLGALTRKYPEWYNPRPPDSGDIILSGANAPMFVGKIGIWDQDTNILTVKLIKETMIYAGEKIRFFIESDQYFKLPYAMYPNDPSFRIEIPEAGIRPAAPFKFSTRVNIRNKTFIRSMMTYEVPGSTSPLAFPGEPADVLLKFEANVEIPAGSIIQLSLPGFQSNQELIRMQPPVVPLVGQNSLHYWNSDLEWDQQEFKLNLHVPIGYKATRGALSVVRIMTNEGGFVLPKFTLNVNDPRLTIAVIENQIVFPEPIKSSPRVVERSFSISEFDYQPLQQESIFLFKIRLQPTVNISETQPIVMNLPGFRNSLSKLNIHVTGPGRELIRDSMAQWNATTSELRLYPVEGGKILADTIVELQIQESQGFILPSALHANDTNLQIRSENNIPAAPVLMSPKVGSGPTTSPPHLFCMYQHERGTKTSVPICTAAVDSYPPLTDPCNEEELERCGCSLLSPEIQPIRIQGFNLDTDDVITFLPEEQLCGSKADGVLSSFAMPNNITVSADKDILEFHGISSIDTGYFRICIMHQGKLFDVGRVTVRPSCGDSYVMVDGVCVQHCPKTKVPTAGACLRDPVAGENWDSQALMLPIRMTDPNIAKADMADATLDDPERKYFAYRFVYELAKILNCDPKRITIASLSNGSIIVNTIFIPVVEDGEQVTTDERSPMGLISLLQALQRDSSSQLYSSPFFKQMDRIFRPEPLRVRMCYNDGIYRIFCPFERGSIMPLSVGFMVFGIAVLVCPCLIACCCYAAWHMDMEGADAIDEDTLEKVKKNPKLVKPDMQVEYARSWLEGRFMGEEWENARQRKLIPIGN